MITRRELLRKLGVGAAVAPFLGNLPSFASAPAARQRLVIVFVDRKRENIRGRIQLTMFTVEGLHIRVAHNDHADFNLTHRFSLQHGIDDPSNFGIEDTRSSTVVEFDTHASRASSEIR